MDQKNLDLFLQAHWTVHCQKQYICLYIVLTYNIYYHILYSVIVWVQKLLHKLFTDDKSTAKGYPHI